MRVFDQLRNATIGIVDTMQPSVGQWFRVRDPAWRNTDPVPWLSEDLTIVSVQPRVPILDAQGKAIPSQFYQSFLGPGQPIWYVTVTPGRASEPAGSFTDAAGVYHRRPVGADYNLTPDGYHCVSLCAPQWGG